MTRTIAALTIALLITGCKQTDKDFTIKTIDLFLSEKDFIESKFMGKYQHIAFYDLPEFPQIAWEAGGVVLVHACSQDRGLLHNLDVLGMALEGIATEIDTESPLDICRPLWNYTVDMQYSYEAGELIITHGAGKDYDHRQAKMRLLQDIGNNSVLRVTIIAPAQ